MPRLLRRMGASRDGGVRGTTNGELYNLEKVSKNLRAAHERNDEVVERIYIGHRFKNDTDRLEKLFEMYTNMTRKGAT